MFVLSSKFRKPTTFVQYIQTFLCANACIVYTQHIYVRMLGALMKFLTGRTTRYETIIKTGLINYWSNSASSAFAAVSSSVPAISSSSSFSSCTESWAQNGHEHESTLSQMASRLSTYHKHTEIIHSIAEARFAIWHHHFCLFFHTNLQYRKQGHKSGRSKLRLGNSAMIIAQKTAASE